MSQQLVICEKPSAAISISAVLGAKERGDGFFHGGGYIVSWCFGHLVELAQPDAYDEKYAKWRYRDLPIVPETWRYAVPKDKAKQLNVLSGLMNRTDVGEVVNACDAGREGELIFRMVYEYCKCKKPVKRFWVSSMEDAAIREGFAKLRPGAVYDNLHTSALCRAQADWVVGLNATRLFSVLYGATLSVGRVQSPTLAMLVARDAEIVTFVKEVFYTVEIACEGFTASSDRQKDKAAAEAIRSACDGKTATITVIEQQRKTVSPPKLYDLTALQRDANRLLGYTAQQTLDYAQSLYEKKLLTYPRTDSRFLTSDMANSVRDIIRASTENVPAMETISFDVEQVVNDAKVTDHHAIIQTSAYSNADPSALPVGERNLIHLVATRLLAATAPKHICEATTVSVDCEGNAFTAKGKTVIEDGWKAVENVIKHSFDKPLDSNDTEDDAALPEAAQGQTFGSVTASVKEGATTPPKHFTEDTLLSAMENAGAEDMLAGGHRPEDAERRGLGTPATRAGIIEKIIKSGFAERQRKNLLPTDKGKSLIAVLPDILTSPKLTAEWEHRLHQIQCGESTGADFMAGIAEMTGRLVKCNTKPQPGKESLFAAYASQPKQPTSAAIGDCPRCGASVREGSNGFFCDSRVCGFKLWRDAKFFTHKKKEITKAIAAALLKDGRVAVTGFYSEKTGKTYDAVVVLDDADGQYVNFKLDFGIPSAASDNRRRK